MIHICVWLSSRPDVADCNLIRHIYDISGIDLIYMHVGIGKYQARIVNYTASDAASVDNVFICDPHRTYKTPQSLIITGLRG